MSTYTATTQVKTLMEAGMTLADINRELIGYKIGPVRLDASGEYEVNGRRYQTKLADMVAKVRRPAPVAPQAGQPLATEKQVSYAMGLIGRAVRWGASEDRFPTYSELVGMTRYQVSAFIDTMKEQH